MDIKKKIQIFRSKCPAICNPVARAKYDLELITGIVREMDGEIEDFVIDVEDCGHVYVILKDGLHRWECHTDYKIQPKSHGGRDLQEYIDWLVVRSKGIEYREVDNAR